MFLEIPEILASDELARLQQIARSSAFVDGRVSNPHSQVKKSLQLRYGEAAHVESSKILAAALQRSPLFRNAAFPKVMAPPMLTKYEVGGNYGLHSDAAFLPVGDRPLRTDLSCTVFVTPPQDYAGGELYVDLGARAVEIKGEAGSAVVYPSYTLHRVNGVTAGERVVGLTFIESRIPDPNHRDLLFKLNEVAALEGLNMQADSFVSLQNVQMRLLRMWATEG